MAKKNETSSDARTEKIDVNDPAQARALAAAWRGVKWFLGGNVDRWEITKPDPDSSDDEVREFGQLVAHGFSIAEKHGVEPSQILSDIGKRDRRLEFLPTYRIVVEGKDPEPFVEPQDMTNFMVLFLKGSVQDGTSKTPEYVRKAVADYKSAHGLATRRGPKRKIIRLDNLDELDEATVRNIPRNQLDKFVALAERIAKEVPEVVETISEDVPEAANAK